MFFTAVGDIIFAVTKSVIGVDDINGEPGGGVMNMIVAIMG